MQIVIDIPPDKEEDFKKGFLRQLPVPTDGRRGPPNMSDDEWILSIVKRQTAIIYSKGKVLLAKDEELLSGGYVKPIVDKEIIP